MSVESVVSPGALLGCELELPSVTQIWSTKLRPFAFCRAKVCVPEPERGTVTEAPKTGLLPEPELPL